MRVKAKDQNVQGELTTRLEAPIIDHLRGFAPNLKKHEMMQLFPMYEDKN
jgi:hypothetical protein